MPIPQKRTKIVATIGPASRDDAILRSLLQSGMNVARLNFSHGTPPEHGAVIDALRRISDKLEIHTAVLQDLPGPKVRTGELSGDATSVRLERGQPFTLEVNPIAGDARHVSVSYAKLPADVTVGKRIYLADGAIALRITARNAKSIETIVEVGGQLRPVQGINYPDGSLNIAAVTERDLEFLEFGLSKDVDWVAVSFVRSADDIAQVKAFIAKRHGFARVLAKIERHEALNDIENIIKAADGIMIARGDLGIEMPLEVVPMIQKDLVARCNRVSKPVITATQMLESMISSPRPTRAEAADVANAILDGSDAVMLSGETAVGAYPTEAVRVMAQIAVEVERSYPHEILHARRLENIRPDIASSIAESAVRSADELELPYIVTGTTTGNTAHHISAFRPRARIIALTPVVEVARRLALIWGVDALLIDEYASFDELLEVTEQRLKHAGLANPGDCVAFTTGMPVGAGGTNVLKIHRIS
ncbi:MAG: pyruvate kinase [Candidatus Eremiobacteraeota bacterium]|nr:pyruvate kinase [Candidatus Eremiobacteraeota bacterium]